MSDIALGPMPAGGYPVTVFTDGTQKSSPPVAGGDVAPAYVPSCSAHASSGQAIPTNAETLLVFDVEDSDPLGNYSPPDNTFTAPKDGWYSIWAQVPYDLEYADETFSLHVQVDGVVTDTIGSFVTGGAVPQGVMVGTGMVRLTAGQTVGLSVFLTGTNGFTIPDQARLKVVFTNP